MQSQQKRVKWSRGETAEALEERTDTGITQASVELMENCIPDIYGNISRRPALSVFKSKLAEELGVNWAAFYFKYDPYMQVIPFYISEDDIILIGVHYDTGLEFIRLNKDDGTIYKYNGNTSVYPKTKAVVSELYGFYKYAYRPVSWSQQNNFMIVADCYNIYKISFSGVNSLDASFTPNVDLFRYSAGFYAPNGTTTVSVSSTEVPNLSISGNFSNYTYIDAAGVSTVFSQTSTNVNNSDLNTLLSYIPLGSIVQMPNNGGFLRVEGYYNSGGKIRMYGSLLTPVADSSATDSIVNVETGYVDLMPTWNYTASYPHPSKVLFSNQRLWTAGWQSTEIDQWALMVGSQIAKYNDLANNYNLANEAITADILTQFKEKILFLVEYNGIKIFTNSYEYAYSEASGAVKQSANGSWPTCEPIVFESLCLYVDSTGNQVRAMQYEFQTSVYESSCINQVAPHDLIFNPICMAQYEDKINSTGKYLFVLNEKSENNPHIAVCNFVPSNQANIWSRWKFPDFEKNDTQYSLIQGIINTKTEPLFLINVWYSYLNIPITIVAHIDWKSNADIESYIRTIGTVNYVEVAFLYGDQSKTFTIPNTLVNVYADGVFQWQDTTDSSGALTKDISGLTNVTAGLPINSTIRSHPIDVGGKTKSVMKRIGKAQMSVHGTDAGAITINGKTGYMNPRIDHICFYGVTGMKDEIKYIITNKNGAMFHLESLLMNIEYGTLDS